MRRRSPHRCSCAWSAFPINPWPTAFILYIFLISNFPAPYPKAISQRGASRSDGISKREAGSEERFDRCFDRRRDNRAGRGWPISREELEGSPGLRGNFGRQCGRNKLYKMQYVCPGSPRPKCLEKGSSQQRSRPRPSSSTSTVVGCSVSPVRNNASIRPEKTRLSSLLTPLKTMRNSPGNGNSPLNHS